MKLAIIGSRNIQDFDLSNVVPGNVSTIISGGASGVDSLARTFANKRCLELIEFLPEYNKYGRSAPILRNKLIVNAADSILAIWDGKSKGTAFTIEYARKLNKPVTIIRSL